jgi:ATP-binding cassette subfamily B protein
VGRSRAERQDQLHPEIAVPRPGYGWRVATAAEAAGPRFARGFRDQISLGLTYWRYYLYATSALLIITALEIAVPTLVGLAVDHGIERHDTHTAVLWALAILAASTGAALANLAWFFEDAGSVLIERDLRRACVDRLHRLHVGFHDRYGAGELIARTSTDCRQAASFLIGPTGPALALPTTVAISAILFLMNWQLAAIALAALPGMLFLGRRSAVVLQPESRRLQREIGALTSVVEDTLLGMRVVKGLGAEDAQLVRLRTAASGVYEQSVTLARRRAVYEPAWVLIPALGASLVLWYGGGRVLTGDMTLGRLVAFIAYLALLVRPMNWLGNSLPRLLRSMAGLERVEDILHATPEVVEAARPQALPHVHGELAFANVSFRYARDRRDVLSNLSLVVPAGTSLAVVGATGAGKSTLLQLLARFYDPTEGRITLDGVDLREAATGDLRGALGFVFQETVLFDATVRENIAIGNPAASAEQVEDAARLAGAHDFVLALPDRYETPVGERGLFLSGGQRQRIGIARALLKEPRVLLLDDPTSALDAATEASISDALGGAMRGRTSLLVTSRPATIRLAERAALLEDGAVTAEGSPDELLASNERYRTLLALLEHPDG